MAKYIPLKPIKPDITIGMEYQIKLVKLIKKMNDDYIDGVKDLYNSQLAQDSDFTTQLAFLLKRVLNKWQPRFNEISKKLSGKFIGQISADTRRKLIKEAKDLITIEPDKHYKRIVNLHKSLINQNVLLIKDLPQKLYNDISGDMMRSLAIGSSISPESLIEAGLPVLKNYINAPLEERTKQIIKRARRISRDQLFKATSLINNARMIENGITHSEWNHSHGDKNPRPSHLKADGKIFDNTKGLLIDGEYIFPAQLIGCTCFATPHIKLSND